MRKVFIFLLVISSFAALGKTRNDTLKKSTKHHVEFFLLPLILHNSSTLGYSARKGDKEISLIGTTVFSLITNPLYLENSINLNYNKYFKNNVTYLALWSRTKQSIKNVHFEEGYFPHTLRFSIGSGIGWNTPPNAKIKMRVEFGFGATLNLTTSKSPWDIRNFSYDKYYPQYNSKVLPATKFKINFKL